MLKREYIFITSFPTDQIEVYDKFKPEIPFQSKKKNSIFIYIFSILIRPYLFV